MPKFQVMLTTLGEPKSEFLEYEADTLPDEGAAICVDGRWAGIREAITVNGGGILLDCRRFYLFEMVDADGHSVGAGEYFHEHPSMPVGQRFMPEEEAGKVFLVVGFENEGPTGFDGQLVVEPFDD
jgi:hypothetical protein